MEELAPTLRVFEGCARALVGDVEGANVVKLHRFSGKVTYLVRGAIDRDPNPEVSVRVKVNLRTLAIDIFDYSGWTERLAESDTLEYTFTSKRPMHEGSGTLRRLDQLQRPLRGSRG